ncbi:hypothetical protein N0V93_008922 [Gnomoniopsis smithogilvyi]|uniref:Uncharacterized protein n=1 Tax=Gnomoniopsis smithogilvyi TaxID=1191159 RepID=A0A9W8YJG1_9PEZI|nr:hypothetical protein N0V93_008922 [Gnomoniopsis smithogilvyi]
MATGVSASKSGTASITSAPRPGFTQDSRAFDMGGSENIRNQNQSHQIDGGIHFQKFDTPLMEVGDECCGIWPENPKDAGFNHHASFGHNGTTATISRFGDIMQVTQFLGHGKSGLFSIDQEPTEEPYYVVDRAKALGEISESPFGAGYSYFFRMSAWPDVPPTTIKWVSYRWPRFEWELEGKKIVFQYYVHKGIVLQQLLFQNLSDEKWELDLAVVEKMAIRDLDFLSPQASPEEATKPSEPVEYGFVRTKSFPSSLQPLSTIAASMDVFIDGQRQKFKESLNVPLSALTNGECREIVAAYSLRVVPTERGNDFWQKSMLPAAEANISTFLWGFRKLEEDKVTVVPPPRDISLTPYTTNLRAQAILGNDSENTRQHTALPPTTADPPQEVVPVFQSKSDGLRKRIRKLRYLTARHLEHILSVCAVPIADPNTEPGITTGVALTCGDMSGHRICTSASL